MADRDTLEAELAANHVIDDNLATQNHDAMKSKAGSSECFCGSTGPTVTETLWTLTGGFDSQELYYSTASDTGFRLANFDAQTSGTDVGFTTAFDFNVLGLSLSPDCSCAFAITNNGGSYVLESVNLDTQLQQFPDASITGLLETPRGLAYDVANNRYLTITRPTNGDLKIYELDLSTLATGGPVTATLFTTYAAASNNANFGIAVSQEGRIFINYQDSGASNIAEIVDSGGTATDVAFYTSVIDLPDLTRGSLDITFRNTLLAPGIVLGSAALLEIDLDGTQLGVSNISIGANSNGSLATISPTGSFKLFEGTLIKQIDTTDNGSTTTVYVIDDGSDEDVTSFINPADLTAR